MRNPPLLATVPFMFAEYRETFPPLPTFDGVACDDGHSTMKLLSANSNLMFNTPMMDDWMSETSLEFWFKISNWDIIEQNTG